MQIWIFIGIDIDKGILQNIDINKILYRLEFGISNRAIFVTLGLNENQKLVDLYYRL